MPGITLTLSGPREPELAGRLAKELTALAASVLHKDEARTVAIVRFSPAEDWYVASRSLAELGRRSFRLQVTVTDETCTKAQKAAFHRAAFDLLAARIPDLHPHSNIHVIDCRGSAYGYGGITQERRAFEETGRA